jgi:DNA-binding NarL/FixJ family response regulator
VERHSGVSTESPPVPQVVVFSDHHLIAQGLVDLGVLERAVRGTLRAAVVDARAAEAERAIALTRALGASAIVLIGSVDEPIAEALIEDADAVLVRDEVDPRALRLALAAAGAGMRLLPRGLPRPAPSLRAVPVQEPLAGPAQQALALLAEGKRDAEIALELSLSESAVRKLIQRTLRRSGARTRCEAVASAIRSGELG